KFNSILVNSTLNAKLTDFCALCKCCYINLYSYFHYHNQYDLPNWTIVYSTIEIGHRTLDPPASNRKSVLIPIVQKRKSTLSITYKCHYTAICRLFFCTFQHRNTLDMRSLREHINWINFVKVITLFLEEL